MFVHVGWQGAEMKIWFTSGHCERPSITTRWCWGLLLLR